MQAVDNALVRLGMQFTRLEGNIERLVTLNSSIVNLHTVLGTYQSALDWMSTTGTLIEPSSTTTVARSLSPVPTSSQSQQPSASTTSATTSSTKATTSTSKSTTNSTNPKAASTTNASSTSNSSRKRPLTASSSSGVPSAKKPRKAAVAHAYIIAALPMKYKAEEHATRIGAVVDALRGAGRDGLYLQDLVGVSGASKLLCNEYLVQLVRAGFAVRESRKGLVYKLKE